MPSSISINPSPPMNKSERNAKLISDLIDEMSWLLSQPPTCVGAKVRPEEEMANELGLTRRQVREAISFFTDKGILVRRQGSGTYVRRIHSHPADSVESKTFGLTHELLFLDLQSNGLKTLTLPKNALTTPVQALCIGLWTDWQLSPPHTTAHVVLSLFMQQAQLSGHTMTIHSQVASSKQILSVDEMARQLQHTSDDGFLVGSQYADTFLQAHKIAGSKCPYLFHSMGSPDFDMHPSINIDTAKACETALLKFVNLGYQRIGTLAMTKSLEFDLEHYIHQSVMNRSQLDESFWAYSQDMGVASAMQATRLLLKKSDGKLDAIYVANDMVLVGVVEALTLEGLIPGKDIAIITLGNRGYPLPHGYDWSVLEFDPESFANITIRQLCHQIQSPDMQTVSLSIKALWKPGSTHQLKK